MKYEVNVRHIGDGKIETCIDYVGAGYLYNDPSVSVRETIMRQVIDTREEQTKRALIALGWTPPRHEERRDGGRKYDDYRTSYDPRIRALERRKWK